MLPISVVLDIQHITDELVYICYMHNKLTPIDVKCIVQLSACIVEDLIIYGQSLHNTLPKYYPDSLFPEPPPYPKDDLFKLRKYIIIDTLVDNDVPYHRAVAILDRLEEYILNELDERNIKLNSIVRADSVYDTVILRVLQ